MWLCHSFISMRIRIVEQNIFRGTRNREYLPHSPLLIERCCKVHPPKYSARQCNPDTGPRKTYLPLSRQETRPRTNQRCWNANYRGRRHSSRTVQSPSFEFCRSAKQQVLAPVEHCVGLLWGSAVCPSPFSFFALGAPHHTTANNATQRRRRTSLAFVFGHTHARSLFPPFVRFIIIINHAHLTPSSFTLHLHSTF